MDAAAALRETILEKLRTRTWRAGHRLPAERALGEEFGLSRSTVRRVLLDFKRKRLITQTVGSGTYVSEQVNEALGSLLTKVKVGLAKFESELGPVLMVAVGATVSTVHVRVAGEASV